MIKKSGSPEGVLIHRPGKKVQYATKSLATHKSNDGKYGWVEGYLVTWGDESDTDLQGEHFTPRTEFCLDWFQDRPVLYHHGLDGQAGLRKIGNIKTLEPDDLGLWVQAQLDLRDRYANAVYDMVKAKEFGWSSGSVDHLVKIATNGEILIWPLIEGSITPTPAQPSKTSVRPFKSSHVFSGSSLPPITMGAYKAILSDDHEYLRGLNARVDYAIKSSSGSSMFSVGENSMAKNSARRLARKFANAFNIRTTSGELDEVAAQMEGIVDEEVAQAAAEELENEALLTALEEEMIQEELPNMSYRSGRRANTRNMRRPIRRSYRNADEAVAEDVAAQMEDDLAAQMDEVAAEMAEEIAAEMEDELALQMEESAAEKRAARSIRRRALRRALRQLEATDDTGTIGDVESDLVVGGVGGAEHLGDPSFANPPVENFKRYRGRGVRRAYRQDDSVLQDPVFQDSLMPDAIEQDDLATASALRRARRNAARRRAYRQADPYASDSVLQDPLMQDAIYQDAIEQDQIASLRRARRNATHRRALRQAEPTLQDALGEVAAQEDSILMEEVAQRAYNNGFRKGIRRAFRTTDTVDEGQHAPTIETPADPSAIATDAEKRARRRAMRRAERRRSVRRAYRQDDSLLQDPLMQDSLLQDPVLQDTVLQDPLMSEEAALQSFRKGYRAARRRAQRRADVGNRRSYRRAYRQDDSVLQDPLMQDPTLQDPMLQDPMLQDELALSGDFEGSKRYGRGNRMKSYNRGFKSLEEAPSRRNFGRMSVTDVADRRGNYNHAFKSYLFKGLGLLNDTEKYILQSKGKVDWSDARGSFKAVGGGAYKTYFGGSDASAGFAVPPDWVAELNKNIMTQTHMAGECRTRTTTSDRIVQPSILTSDARRAHAAQVRWPGEVITNPTAEHETIEDTYRQIDIPIHVMLLSLLAGNSALEDVTFDLESEINEAFSEAVAVAYDTLIWGGDGQGKMEGIVVNSNVTGTRSTGIQTVSGYVPTGSADGIVTADSLKEMLFHLPQGFRQNAKWYMNSNTGLQISTLKDGEGNYLIDQRDEALQSVGVPDRLLGRPIVYNEYADDIAADAFPIILGDLSRGYTIGQRVDFTIRRFDDSGQADYDRVKFIGRARIGGQVTQETAIKVLKVAVS